MQSITLNITDGYWITSLCADNCEIVENLCLKCSDYYNLLDGISPSRETVNEIFLELPPDKNYEDKYVLGIYKSQNKLVGIVDIVRDFPTTGEWMLGLMLIEPEERGIGLGTVVHKALIEWAINFGAKSFRIGVLQDNHNAIRFWSGLGYKKIKEVEMDFTARIHKVNVMRLMLWN